MPQLMTTERPPFFHHFSFSTPKFQFPSSVRFDSLPARKFSFPGGAKWLQRRGWKEVVGGWKTNRTTPCFITASQSHFFPSRGRTSGLLPWERTGMWSHCARTQQLEEKECLYWEFHSQNLAEWCLVAARPSGSVGWLLCYLVCKLLCIWLLD